MVKTFEEQTEEAVRKAELLNNDMSSINEKEAEKHPMKMLFHATHNMFKSYHVINDITIAAAVHDAKIDHEKGGNSVEGFAAVNKALSALQGVSVDVTKEMQGDYQDLKKAVYETHVLGVGKNMKEKAATVVKNAGRVVAGIFAEAFQLTGESLKLVGNLVKLAPIAGYVIDRLPRLSYSTEKRDGIGATGQQHNLVEGLGEGFKEAAKQLNKFAMPVHSKKNEVILNMQKQKSSTREL